MYFLSARLFKNIFVGHKVSCKNFFCSVPLSQLRHQCQNYWSPDVQGRRNRGDSGPSQRILKVSWFRKQIVKPWILPKNKWICFYYYLIFFSLAKGQLISKANCQPVNSSKKPTNELFFTTMRRLFVRFLEEIEDTKKTFRNYLTFRFCQNKSWIHL